MKKRRNEPTPQQKLAAQQKRDRFKRFVKQVADMTDEQRQEMAGSIGIVTCEGHSLSMTNTLLTVLQNPKATVIGGFRQWMKNGRAVRKGEHGHMIWVPTVSKDSSVKDSDVRFLTATVFDISQTEELAAKEDAA